MPFTCFFDIQLLLYYNYLVSFQLVFYLNEFLLFYIGHYIFFIFVSCLICFQCLMDMVLQLMASFSLIDCLMLCLVPEKFEGKYEGKKIERKKGRK